MFVKVHESAKGKVVAICDSELLGRRFDEGDLEVDLVAKRGFYEGEKKDVDSVRELLGAFDGEEGVSFNIVGERAVGVAVSVGLVGEGSVLRVDGVPIAMVF